jgi:hypothetical protein
MFLDRIFPDLKPTYVLAWWWLSVLCFAGHVATVLLVGFEAAPKIEDLASFFNALSLFSSPLCLATALVMTFSTIRRIRKGDTRKIARQLAILGLVTAVVVLWWSIVIYLFLFTDYTFG